MKNFTIYTDGSHLKHTTGRLGIGGVLIDENGNKIDEFSVMLSPEYLMENFGTTEVSNPTCEMLANLFALRNFKDQIKNCYSLTMKADYEGVQKFNLGIWKAKESYIKKIKELTEEEVRNQRLQQKIHYEWVKGHQKRSVLSEDAKWNDYVDKLAKGEL